MKDSKVCLEEMVDLDKTYAYHIQRYYSDGVVTTAHIHNFAEIICGIDCDYTLYIDDEVYNFKSGDLAIVFPNQMHKIISHRKEVSEHVCLRFNPYSIIDTSRYIIPFILKDKRNKCYFTADELTGHTVSDIFFEIYKETQECSYGFEIAMKAYLQQICLFLLRWWKKEGELNVSTVEESRMFDVLLYIEQHYQEEISVSEMAKKYFVSCSYFSRWFKKVTGKTFKQYVNYVRINRAIQLLLNSDYNITEVAMMTGFATTSYFIKQFKGMEGGLSPKRFKRKYRENN